MGFIKTCLFVFWRRTKVLWDDIRVSKWSNIFYFCMFFIIYFFAWTTSLNLIQRNLLLSLENLLLTRYGKTIHLSMKSSCFVKHYNLAWNNTAFTPFPQNLCCYTTLYPPVTSLFSPIWSVCWLLGSSSYCTGERAVSWQRETNIIVIFYRVKLTCPRRQFIWTPGLEKRVMDSQSWHNRMTFHSFRCTMRLNCLSLKTWTQEGKVEIQIWVNFSKPVKNMSYFSFFRVFFL